MDWYQFQPKASLTPPSWVFVAVWNVIYLCGIVSAILVWKRLKRDTVFWIINVLFILNLFANAAWTYLYFVKHLIGFALLDAIFLILTTWALVGLIWKRDQTASLLLLPYGCWLFFALYLNYYLFMFL
jgi:translocator protein